MNKKIVMSGLVLICVLGIIYTSRSVTKPNQNSLVENTTPTKIVTETKQDPQDIVAGLFPNPIVNVSVAQGFEILGAMAENNMDANAKAVDDHLELSLKNATNQDLSGFEVYYTITDTVTNQKEGYYKSLGDFVLKANETRSIHFDNKMEVGHFNANTNNLYYSSKNQLSFEVMVSAPGYKIESIQFMKDAGGAEESD